MEPTILTNQNPDPEPLPQQNIFFFDLYTEDRKAHKIKFNSAFDSGNMRQVTSPAPYTYMVQTAPDCCGTKYEGFSKSWYYFGVSGVPTGTTLNFIVKKISILYQMYKSAPEAYKPVCRVGDSGWQRIEERAVIMEGTEDKGLEVRFSYTFNSQPDEEVFFAFSYPFSYEESQKLLEEYDVIYQKDADIYYHREVITRSVQERDIDLVTISSHEGKLRENESDLHEELFPNKVSMPRARKFRNNKPVVLLTARVHPGETPASHTMNGVLKFLLDKKDIRAQLLRQYFVFMLVPMINPDGVYNGHYRMDTYNQNLNRYYKNPDSKKHPAIFAIKELVQYLHMESRLFFYCDLHAHAAKKGCFLYGNALDFVMQVETILFAKVMSVNCINFEFDSCNFSKKQMNSRDKGEKLTKEGAGRVAIHKICNLVHSYTMECGLHFSNELNRIAAPNSTKNCFEDHISDINSEIYRDSPTYYSIDIYENLGKGMLVSILDIFHKNPCTRMSIASGVTIENMRKEIASRVVKIHRFWKEAHVKRKCLKINEIIKELFYDEFDKKNVFSVILASERKLYSASASLKRLPQNTLTKSDSLAGKIDKKLLSEVVGKVKDEQNMIVNEWNVDENVENVEDLIQLHMVKSLPKLKTPIALRDFRLKHNEARALHFEGKPGKEEVLPTISSYESKLSFHPKLPIPERGVLVYTKSDVPSLNDLNTPTRANLAIRERRNLQNHSQQPSIDNLSIRGGKRSTTIKKNQSTIPKGHDIESGTVTLEPFMYMNSSGNQPLAASVNLNPTGSGFQGNFFVVGKPNYIIPKGKLKSSIGNMYRKTKGA